MFDRFKQFGVIINPAKCELGVSELTFLGHYLNTQGVRPLHDKVKVIQDFPQPTTQRKLREFLGLVNFTTVLFLIVETSFNPFIIY